MDLHQIITSENLRSVLETLVAEVDIAEVEERLGLDLRSLTSRMDTLYHNDDIP